MNRRINIKLNFIEACSLMIGLLCYGLTMYFRINDIVYSKLLFSILGLISLISMVTIESFLFILLKNKYKAIYILYIISVVVLSFIFSSSFPFIIILILTIGTSIKTFYRITFVDNIYIKNEFKRYCKMFGIVVKRDIRRKRVNRVKKNSGVPIKNRKSLVMTVSRNKKSTRKTKESKSYA